MKDFLAGGCVREREKHSPSEKGRKEKQQHLYENLKVLFLTNIKFEFNFFFFTSPDQSKKNSLGLVLNFSHAPGL